MVTRLTVFCNFLPNERYYKLYKLYQFLALNIVLYILVFVYYSFYEYMYRCISYDIYVYFAISIRYMYIFKMGKTMKKKKKKNVMERNDDAITFTSKKTSIFKNA